MQHKVPELSLKKKISKAEVEYYNYLVVIDQFYRWLEILSMKDKTSETTVQFKKNNIQSF